MIDYDTKKALAILASGKTNFKALMDEIKVAKTAETQKAILDKYHAAGKRTVAANDKKPKKPSMTTKTNRRKRGTKPRQIRRRPCTKRTTVKLSFATC